jgi:hypothetical protein
VRPAKYQSRYQSPIAPPTAAAQQIRETKVEPHSIVLFFLLLSAFIAILTLRAHLLAPIDSSAMVAASKAPPIALAAKRSSRRPNF